MKTPLIALAVATLSLAIAAPSFARSVHDSERAADCSIEKGGKIVFKGKCRFSLEDTAGSFVIATISGRDSLFRRVAYLEVKVVRPGVAAVRAALDSGRDLRWGTVHRSTADRACWVGSGLKICAR